VILCAVPFAGEVYFLADPRAPNAPRYVGKTSRGLTRRLYGHLASARHGGRAHRDRWVSSLLLVGLSPAICRLSVAWTEEQLNTQERAWIDGYRAAGVLLCNLTDGGDGTLGHSPSPEARAKKSAALIGRKRPPEVCSKIGDSKRGRVLSPEHRAKLSVAGRGRTRTFSLGHRAKLSARQTGRSLSAEHRANIGAGLRQAWARPEVKANRIAAQRATDPEARRRSALIAAAASNQPEARARRAMAIRVALADPDVRLRRNALTSLALKAAWARRKAAGTAS